MTVSGVHYSCQGMGVVHVQLPSELSSLMEMLAVSTRPLNFNFIFCINGVSTFCGVTVCHQMMCGLVLKSVPPQQ